MSVSIELTAAQARVVARLAEQEGVAISLRQLSPTEPIEAAEVYATPHGTTTGYRISTEGELARIGETLPGID
jgi:hypothetical protein